MWQHWLNFIFILYNSRSCTLLRERYYHIYVHIVVFTGIEWHVGPTIPCIYGPTDPCMFMLYWYRKLKLLPMHVKCTCICRSTPVETVHTILLGPFKYLLKEVMATLSTVQKKEVLARMAAFHWSGFDGKVIGNVVYHHKSFVGRDYKAWAQMSLFIIGPYLSAAERAVWLDLSKVSVYTLQVM